jgi:hypothetical protein
MQIVSYEERCVFCRKREGTLLCDFITSYVWTSIDFKKIPQTCDRRMCEECATELSQEFHFCPKCIDITKQRIFTKNQK